MKNLLIILFLISTIIIDMYAQDKNTTKDSQGLPYYQIPDYPESYTPENVAARMIDGLGFRYYWATEGLTEKDLDYTPGNDGRSTGHTIDHIYGLTLTIVNASLNKPNVFPREDEELTFEQKRARTLENIEKASQVLKDQNANTLENNKVIFQNDNGTSEYPYWNMINGPIADAIYHTGQVVSFRRSSGNPINPNIRQFLGTPGKK
jgi:uncharacterized damage-inducible protein DinB